MKVGGVRSVTVVSSIVQAKSVGAGGVDQVIVLGHELPQRQIKGAVVTSQGRQHGVSPSAAGRLGTTG